VEKRLDHSPADGPVQLTGNELDEVSGGLSGLLASGFAASALTVGSAKVFGPIREGGCPACRSGQPLDILRRDELVIPVINQTQFG
jgi:hypothetical protein